MYSKVQVRVILIRFGPLLTLPVLKADRALMMALAERWSPVTYTFHFPIGDIGMPLIDFYMITGLFMDDTPPLSTDELDLEMVRSCIGPQPIECYKGIKGVLASCFETKYV